MVQGLEKEEGGDVHLSVNVSHHLADMLKQAMLKAGFKTKSEFIRIAIKEKVDHILQTSGVEKHG